MYKTKPIEWRLEKPEHPIREILRAISWVDSHWSNKVRISKSKSVHIGYSDKATGIQSWFQFHFFTLMDQGSGSNWNGSQARTINQRVQCLFFSGGWGDAVYRWITVLHKLNYLWPPASTSSNILRGRWAYDLS